jgi:hypothetical protein
LNQATTTLTLSAGEYGPINVSISINDAYWSFGGSLQGPLPNGRDPWTAYFGVDQFSVFDSGGSFSMNAITSSDPGYVYACDISYGPGLCPQELFGPFWGESFDLEFGLFLTGSIDAIGGSDGDYGVNMQSHGPIWTATAGSDFGIGGPGGAFCGNCGAAPVGTGVWLPVFVPEPTTLALFGLGIAAIALGGLGLMRRRKAS